jgi:hypothetical protein
MLRAAAMYQVKTETVNKPSTLLQASTNIRVGPIDCTVTDMLTKLS